jgi:hypothetical protein
MHHVPTQLPPTTLPEDASLPEPNTLAALKHAIAKDDFGVVAGDDGGKPLPPLAAIRAYKTAGGAVELDRNAPLPLCFNILQVPTAPPSRTPPKIVASMDATFGLAASPPQAQLRASVPLEARYLLGCFPTTCYKTRIYHQLGGKQPFVHLSYLIHPGWQADLHW